MSELVHQIVEFLRSQGVEGWVVIGGVTFHYLSLVFGVIIGVIVGWLTS